MKQKINTWKPISILESLALATTKSFKKLNSKNQGKQKAIKQPRFFSNC